MELLDLVKCIVPPVLIGIALISAGGNKLLPLAVGLGMAMAFVLLKDWPVLPHHLWARPDPTHWLFWCLVAALLVACFEIWKVFPPKLAMGIGIAVVAASVWFVLRERAGSETLGWYVLHIVVGGLAIGGIVYSQRNLIGRSESSPFFPAFVLSILIVDAVVLTLSGGNIGALYGQLCWAFAAGLAAAMATSFWCKPFTMTVADGTWFGAVHGLVLLTPVHISYLTWPAALLAGAAPVLPLALPKSFAKERPKRWMLVALTLAALPATGAIALAGS